MLLLVFGGAIILRAERGVAPWDALTTGTAEATGLDSGIAAMLLPIVFTALGCAIGRAPGTGTVSCALAVGPVLGVVPDPLTTHEALAPRLPPFVIDFPLLAAGFTPRSEEAVLGIEWHNSVGSC